ncbi:hypothetical protein GX420_02250 [bacterium]|nr:hypothetical protein [bacterium]
MDSGTTNYLRCVWGSGPNDVFIVGDDGVILHYNGTSWSSMDSGTTNYLLSVWGNGPNDVFAIGYAGTILHYNGTSWSSMDSGTINTSLGVWGSASNDVYTVGYTGAILHYNGTSWSSMDSGTINDLYAVWGSGPNDIFAIGASGTILHYEISCIITFDTLPPNTGTITFDSVRYNDGDTTSKTPGVYSITANPTTGYKFTRWEVEGSITVNDPDSPNTTCSISGNGTLHVEFEVDSTCFFDTKSGAGIYIDLVTPLAPRWRVAIPSKGYDTGWMPFRRYTRTNNHFWGEYADTRYHLIIDFYSSGRYHIIFDDRVTRISIKIAN